jgi:hypothetical protein
MAVDPTKLALKSSLSIMLQSVQTTLSQIATLKDVSGVPVAQLTASYKSLQTSIQTTQAGADAAATTDLQAQITALNGTLSTLDGQKQTLLAGQPPKPFLTELLQDMADSSFTISVVIGMLLGGIVASHAFLAKPPIYRVYYFIYGAALFPLALLVGIVKPPVYRALLIPLVMKGLTEPGWSNLVFLKPLGPLYKYDPPNPNDSSSLLAVLCGLSVVSILATGILKGFI